MLALRRQDVLLQGEGLTLTHGHNSHEPKEAQQHKHMHASLPACVGNAEHNNLRDRPHTQSGSQSYFALKILRKIVIIVDRGLGNWLARL